MTKNNEEQLDLFFWLGAEGEAFEMTKEEFNDKIKEDRKNLDDFLNAR